MENLYKLWIARDEGFTEYENGFDDDGIYHKGELHIFYDKPLYEGYQESQSHCAYPLMWGTTAHRYWTNARVICEIPSYMFTNIKEGECVEYIEDKLGLYKNE